MGSLGPIATISSLILSRANASGARAPVVVNAPKPVVQTASPAVSGVEKGTSQNSADNTSGDTVAQERETGLLRRSRGRTGTIQTSYRGLLGAADANVQRKTLLGE